MGSGEDEEEKGNEQEGSPSIEKKRPATCNFQIDWRHPKILESLFSLPNMFHCMQMYNERCRSVGNVIVWLVVVLYCTWM